MHLNAMMGKRWPGSYRPKLIAIRVLRFVICMWFVGDVMSQVADECEGSLPKIGSEDQDTEYDYLVKQSCLPAGSTEQNGARVKATIDFYLCCNDPRFGPGKLCCENCLEQWSNYFEWIAPCMLEEGGEKLEKGTRCAMSENFYKYDKKKAVWVCAGNRTTSLSYLLVTCIVFALVSYLS